MDNEYGHHSLSCHTSLGVALDYQTIGQNGFLLFFGIILPCSSRGAHQLFNSGLLQMAQGIYLVLSMYTANVPHENCVLATAENHTLLCAFQQVNTAVEMALLKCVGS